MAEFNSSFNDSTDVVDTDGFPTVARSTDNAFQILNRRTRHVKTAPPAHAPSGHVNAPPSTLLPAPQKPRPGSYAALGLSSEITASLQKAGYNFPTPIQRKLIPPLLDGCDAVAMARTGSGKTAAFLAPILHLLNQSSPTHAATARTNGPRALIVTPTRELALQTLRFARIYSAVHPVRVAAVVGGTPLHAQFASLAVCPQLIIATPGRLLQLLAEMSARGALTLSTTEFVVFDEADRLFEGTLAVETAALLARLRNPTSETFPLQTVLVSATMPHALAEFSRTNLRPGLAVVRLDAERCLSPTMAAAFLLTRAGLEKDAVLQATVRRVVLLESKSVVIFAATHRRVEFLAELLKSTLSVSLVCVHGNMDQMARQDAVRLFRKKQVDVLIVTDVAARGIDLPELDVVINYDMAPTPKLFVHRVGRVGRAGRFGITFSLIAPDELPYMLDIFLFLGRPTTFAQPVSPEDVSNPFKSHAYAMDSSFVLGSLPKNVVDEEVELTRNAIKKVDLAKAHSSAKNAHSLYTKTRGVASGESVRRGKQLFQQGDGSRRLSHVHPWFSEMQSTLERTAAEQAALLSAWRPKECMVEAPVALTKRKHRLTDEKDVVSEEPDAVGENTAGTGSERVPSFMESLAAMNAVVSQEKPTGKLSARQLAMEQEKQSFFLPARQEDDLKRSEKAFKVRSGGAMGGELQAYHELRDAAMDLNADGNADLLRAKHVGGNTGKYWDRVSKKFVKGGITSKTSKANLHVASREAKARSKAGESYGTEDGVLFKKWMSQNRQAVEQLAERVDSGDGESASQFGFNGGLASNDFRKGAFGRRARIAAAAKHKESFKAVDARSGKYKSELKSVEEIKKSRKLKAKAEARRVAQQEKRKGRAKSKKQNRSMPQRGASKTRVIVRR